MRWRSALVGTHFWKSSSWRPLTLLLSELVEQKESEVLLRDQKPKVPMTATRSRMQLTPSRS